MKDSTGSGVASTRGDMLTRRRQPDWRTSIGRNHKLGTRLVSVSIAGLVFGLAMVLGTLWLSWALEGAAAAINDTGSLRVQSVRIGLSISQPGIDEVQVRQQWRGLNETLGNLRRGDPQRPLRLPSGDAVQQQFERVSLAWKEKMEVTLDAVLRDPAQSSATVRSYLDELTRFVQEADRLVSLIEVENARDTAYLRGSQLALIMLMLAGCVAIIYLLYGWVIRPVEALRSGIAKMSTGDFDVRVPVEGHDEFGELATGFNDMAAQLKELYNNLEERVRQKTLLLAQRNRSMATLYEFAAYLSQPGELEDRCKGFLARLVAHFNADGGTVRILDPRQNNLHLTVHQGVSPEFVQQEQCVHSGECLCGESLAQGEVRLHDFRQLPSDLRYFCREQGFNSIAIAPIGNGGKTLGSYTLHFKTPHAFSADDRRLFDSVGQHLGVAIENQRLLARTRELAIAEERNLVAQGLHDSIAQGLNFLKLQVQLLEDSLARDARDEIREVIRMIDAGLRESYDDVRELLMNFRVKLDEGELVDALNVSAERFRQQTGVDIVVDARDEGAPLPPEQQLQLLFIVQEALSNIRKHAHASHVQITVENASDFTLTVADDGCGFDVADKEAHKDSHVGLKIMQERAARLGARLAVTSSPGLGTRIALELEHTDRATA